MAFDGLKAEDLENYREPRSRSNVWSRQRLVVKERLLEGSSALLERLGALGHDMEILAGDHVPSLWNRKKVDRQWIFFSRGRRVRDVLSRLADRGRGLAASLADPTPYFKEAHLSISVSGAGFEAAVKLHHNAWIDRDNFLARISEPEDRAEFLELVRSLPDEYVFGVEGGPERPVCEVDDAFLSAVIEAFTRTEGMISAGLVVPPERCVELGPDLMEVASVAFLLLSPVYDAFTWSEEEDLVSLNSRTQDMDRRRQAAEDELRTEREAFEARRRERREQQMRRFDEERNELLDKQTALERQRRAFRQTVPVSQPVVAQRGRDAARAEPPQAHPPAAAVTEPVAEPPAEAEVARHEQPLAARLGDTPAEPPPEKREDRPPPRRRRRPTLPDGPFVVLPGIRVEIATGILEGKWGIVQEVDRHGEAKIVLGSLVARVPVSDLRQPAR